MKVLLTVWITVCLIQEVTPSTLVRLPRHLSKQPSLVRTEYEAKYEQTGKHGNESSSVVSGKQEIVHNNCAENWNEFAEKCASLIKDLVASLAGVVSSKPGDATNLQLQIKNTFKHFDSTHNCTCFNHTGKKLSDLDLSPLFNNISISTVRPNTNDCNPPCTEATEGKALEEDPTKVFKLQKEKNHTLTDAEHLDMNSENTDGLKDQSTNNYRRQAQVPQALEKKPQKIENLGEPDVFSEDSTYSASNLKNKPALAVSTKPAKPVKNGPLDSLISKPAIKFSEDRDHEFHSSRLPAILTTGSGVSKSIPDTSFRNNQMPDFLLGKYSPAKIEYEKPTQEPLKSVQSATPKGQTLGQSSTKPVLSAKVPKHTKTSDKKPFLVFPVINSNSNLPESSPPENHVETVTSSSIFEPITTNPSLNLSPKAVVTHKNPTGLSQNESTLPELEYEQHSTVQEATTFTPITNNDPTKEDNLHHTMSFVNPVTKILEGANQQSEDITLGKDTVYETAPSTTNGQIPEAQVTISEINAAPITSVSTICSPITETSATSENTAGLTGNVYTTSAPNTAYSPSSSKTSAAQTIIASTINAQSTASSATTSEIPAAQTIFVSTTCTPTKETPATSDSTAGLTNIVYTTPNTAYSSTISETTAASGIVSSATTSETSAAPGASSSAITFSAITSEASAAPDVASSAITSSATTSEASAAPDVASSAITSSATTSEASAAPDVASSAIISSATTSEASAAPDAASSVITSSATTSEASAAPDVASSAITSLATTSEASAAPDVASSAITSSATTSEASAAPDVASSAITSSAITSEASAAPDVASSAITSSAITSEASAAPDAASSSTTDSNFPTESASLTPEYTGTTLQKQTKTPENTQYSNFKVTTAGFIYPLKSSTVVPIADTQMRPQSVETEDSDKEDSLVTEVNYSSSTPVDFQKNTETTKSFVYPLYLQTDAVNRDTLGTSFPESPSETTAEIKPAGPGLLVPKSENLSPQEEGQVPVLAQPTTFQTTSEDPTPSQALTTHQTESTKFLIPTTLAPRNLEGTISGKLASPKFTEVPEDDDDEEDCCSCESCTDEEITDPKQFKENACRDLEEARRELKAIFDKIKKKLKCGRKTPQSITAS